MLTIDQAREMAEVHGVQSFFVTDFFTEAAGGGCIRVYACAKQRGVLVPQYLAVVPYRNMLAGSTAAQQAAIAVMKEELGGGGEVH